MPEPRIKQLKLGAVTPVEVDGSPSSVFAAGRSFTLTIELLHGR